MTSCLRAIGTERYSMSSKYELDAIETVICLDVKWIDTHLVTNSHFTTLSWNQHFFPKEYIVP